MLGVFREDPRTREVRLEELEVGCHVRWENGNWEKFEKEVVNLESKSL
jgi:hypothetical protein